MSSLNNKGVKTTFLGIGTIIALNVATTINIYGFPSEAFYGLTSVSLYGISLLIFLVPVALVSAELGAMYPQEGGIFMWVNNAFNHKVGIFATWLQWVQSVFFYPLSLTFAAVTFSYILPIESLSTSIASNKIYVITFILLVFWVCTYTATKGLKNIGKISSSGVWIGIVIPVFLLFAFSLYYILTGGKVEMNTHPSHLIPHFHNIDQVVMAVSIMLFFSGIEVNGTHVHMMKNPAKDYPKALFITCIIIGAIYIFGTLAIATVIPSKNLSLTQSVIAALREYLSYAGLTFLVPTIALALSLGVIANTITWISGPASVIKYIGDKGYLPKSIQRKNKNGAPITILLAQGVVVTVLVLVYATSSKVQQGYQMLLQMTNAIYLTMYVILFLSFIRLRYKDKKTPRPFMAGKNKFLAWVVTLVGLISAIFSFTLCFFPPQQLNIGDKSNYIIILFAIYILLILPPLIYNWVQKNKRYSETKSI